MVFMICIFGLGCLPKLVFFHFMLLCACVNFGSVGDVLRVIRIFSSHEKHATYSDYHLSVAVKLSIAMFLNTGIIPILSNV